MTTEATPAPDFKGTAAGVRDPAAGRSGSARQAPRQRQPSVQIRRGRAGQTGTATTPADHGLFGPRSATWQLTGAPILWIAGIRALHL